MRTLAALVLASALPGCGGADDDRVETAWTAQVGRAGDTTIVRTVAGSAWGAPRTLVPEVRIGELDATDDAYMIGFLGSIAVDADGAMYAYDRQARALRKYDAEGTFVGTFGRAGAGPGEYRGPDGGLSVLHDGRVVLRDPGNARMTVYAADGRFLATWPIAGGLQMGRQSVVGRDGHLYQPTVRNRERPVAEWEEAIVKWTAQGTVVDTLPVPTVAFEQPILEARSAGGTAQQYVPFSPRAVWKFSPLGYFVSGLGAAYAIDLLRPDGVLRIERQAPRVRVVAGEREDATARVTYSLRRTEPGWRWNGPPVPDTKPPFTNLFVGDDGRIWVSVSRPGETVPDPAPTSPRPDGPPPARWREPVAFDVFEPDGRYLGKVAAPAGFLTFPEPVFRGDHVWAVVRGELDTLQLVRFRIEPAEPDA